MPSVIKSSSTPAPVHGVTDLSSTLGFNQSESETNTGTWADVMDHNGQIVAKILYDSIKNNQVTVVLKQGATLPKLGDLLAIGTPPVNYIIESVAKNAVNNDATRLTLTVTKYQGIDPVAAGAPGNENTQGKEGKEGAASK